MVAKVGGYYESAFKGASSTTQGDPLSPTIFNVVVDVVVRHWVIVMVEIAEEQSGRRKEGRYKNSLFYMDDGMVALSDRRWLQGDFSTLVGLFDRVVLKTNMGKTVGMVCCPCQEAGTQSEAVYGRSMTGSGTSYRKRQWSRIQCTVYGEDMVLVLLAGHIQTQHGEKPEVDGVGKSCPPVESHVHTRCP